MTNEVIKQDSSNKSMHIKRTDNGSLSAVRGVINLSIACKDLVEIKGTISITATGYDKLNKIAGISLVQPEFINVPNHGKQPNPFFIIDERNGSMKFVMSKMSAIGMSPIGNLCVVDQTLLFDLGAYLKMDALSKVKYNKGLGKVTSKEMLTDEDKRIGLFLPILENFGVLIDARHDMFFRIMSEHQQRQRFAERIALGILKRNCLRHHPAIATSIVNVVNGVANVTVTGHRHDLNENDIRKIVNKEKVNDNNIEVISSTLHTDDIHNEDMAMSAIDSKVGEDDVNNNVKHEEDITDKEKSLIRINELKNCISDNDYNTFCSDKIKSGKKVEEFEPNELKRFADLLEKTIIGG